MPKLSELKPSKGDVAQGLTTTAGGVLAYSGYRQMKGGAAILRQREKLNKLPKSTTMNLMHDAMTHVGRSKLARGGAKIGAGIVGLPLGAYLTNRVASRVRQDWRANPKQGNEARGSLLRTQRSRTDRGGLLRREDEAYRQGDWNAPIGRRKSGGEREGKLEELARQKGWTPEQLAAYRRQQGL